MGLRWEWQLYFRKAQPQKPCSFMEEFCRLVIGNQNELRRSTLGYRIHWRMVDK